MNAPDNHADNAADNRAVSAADAGTARLLGQALREEADTVDTDPAALARIQQRTAAGGHAGTRPAAARSTGGRSPWVLGALGAGLATAAVVTSVVVLTDNGSEPSPTTPAAVSTDRQLPIYYEGPRPGHPEGPGLAPPETPSRLYTETHSVAVADGDTALAAVNELLTGEPDDPDYASGWPQGVTATAVTTEATTMRIDLSGDADVSAPGSLTPGQAQSAIQALIYTAADGTQATFTYNGEPLSTLLGVDVSSPVKRMSAEEILAWITIDNLSEGETVSAPITVKVSGNVFEGTVNWRLLDDAGELVDDGFTTTAFGDWAQVGVKLGELEPGTYTFEALEYSVADGDEINLDSKTFVVE